MPSTGWIIGAFLVIVVLFIIGFVLGINYRKKVAEKEMSSAEEEAKLRDAAYQKNLCSVIASVISRYLNT